MPQQIISVVNSARLSSYESEWARQARITPSDVSRPAVAALYVWQVSLSSAWYETLSYTEAVTRNAIDMALRAWNVHQGRSEDWLADAARPLDRLVAKAASDADGRATQALHKRDPTHPRVNAPVTLDDRIAQLDFGNLVFLLPVAPPMVRKNRGSGFTARENLWIHGLRAAFPGLSPELTKSWHGQTPSGLPPAVFDGYAVGSALERLRRLRNRVSHHEQTFRVQHNRRLKDAMLLVRAIRTGAADDLKRLDRVRRELERRPEP